MSKLVVFPERALGAGTKAEPAPEQVEGGEPGFESWTIDVENDGKVVSGIWQAKVGRWRVSKPDAWEFCHIMTGVVELIEEGSEPIRFEPGDSFIVKPGFVGIWNVIEPVSKHFVWRQVAA